MTLALAVLLAVPFVGALASIGAAWRSRLPLILPARATLALAALLVMLLIVDAVHGSVAALSVPWVPILGLALSFRADACGGAFALAVLVLSAVSVRGARDRRQIAATLVLAGCVQALVLADDLTVLAAFAALSALARYLLERGVAADDAEGVEFDFLAATGGSVVLLASSLLVAETTGNASLGALGDGTALGPLALGLFAVGAWLRATRWPWAPDASSGVPLAGGALSMLSAAYLVVRLLPALEGRAQRVGTLVGIPACALALTWLSRALRREPAATAPRAAGES